MATTVDAIKGFVPELNLNSVVTMVSVFILFLVFLVAMSIALYYYLLNRRFNKKIIVLEKIGGKMEFTRKDRAREYPLEMAGDTLFRLKKHNKFIATPSIQTGRNTYMFFIREDGEWENIGIEDIDLKNKELKVHSLDKDMRYARVALQRSLKERYVKPSFFSVYGGLIAYISLIAVTGIFMWLLFDKFLDIGGALQNAIETGTKLAETNQQIVARLDNLQSGGSGLRPA